MPSEGGHRLYVKGRHLSYQRGKRNTNPGTSLIKIEGVDDSQAASFYLGKKVAFVYRARKEVRGSKIRVIWGKITRPHGNSGVRTLRSLEATLTQHPSVKKKAELRAFETAESSNAHLILSLHTQPKAQYHPRASAEGVRRRSPPPIAYNQAPPFATMTRNRRSSMLSFRKASSGSIPKVDATETAKEKAAFHINTKADPTKAINEAQPAARNALEQTTIQSIRTLEHRDAEGNVITDPDRSNPTRPRLERPLDTIRAFEAAIDGSYSRRSSYKADPANPTSPQTIRRSGFFPGHQAQQRSPMDGGGYYGNRNGGSRPDSYIDHSNNSPNQYGNGNINGNGNTNGNGNGRQKFGPRNHSDPALFSHANAPSGVYPSHGHQQSYDTVASASNGSHATDQWGNSTDPSSENSSIDRVQPAAKPDIGEAYGFNGFGAGPQIQGPILEEHGQGAPGYGQPGYGQERVADGNGFPYQGNGAPIPPPHAPSKENAPRVPIKLGGSSGSGNAAPVSKRPAAPVDTEKRKSWLKRRFSKG